MKTQKKMSKLYYRTGDGEKKLNCYSLQIPKRAITEAGINAEKQVVIYTKGNKIIIEEA